MEKVGHVTVAARIDRLPILSMHRKLVIVLGIGTFFDLYDIFLAGVLGTVLTTAFHLNNTQTALIISSGFIGMFFGAIFLGSMSDYLGRRAMYMVNLLIYSVFSLTAAFSPNFIWVVIFRFLAGWGLGAEPPLTDIYMGELIPRAARGRYTAWSYTLGFLGVPIAGLAGRLLVPHSYLSLPGWRWLLILGSLGALIVWFLRRNLPESPRWYEIRQQVDAANAAMNAIERQAMSEYSLEELPTPERIEVKTQKRAAFKEIFTGIYAKRTTMLWIFQILQTVGYYGFGTLATFVLTHKGFSIVASLGYTALSFFGYPLGSLLSIPLVERFERKWLIVGSALVMAVLGLLFSFATVVPVIIVTGFLLTAISNIFSNSFHIYQAEIFPTRIRGTAVGIAYSFSRLTSAILPFVAIPVSNIYGPIAVFSGSAILMVLLSLDIGLLGPLSTKQSLEIVAK